MKNRIIYYDSPKPIKNTEGKEWIMYCIFVLLGLIFWWALATGNYIWIHG